MSESLDSAAAVPGASSASAEAKAAEAKAAEAEAEADAGAAQEDYARSVQLGTQVSCQAHLDALMYCFSPPCQFSSYYQRGEVEPCEDYRRNFFSCLRLKTRASLAEKEDIVRQLNMSEDRSPSHSVWQFRKDPAADWPYVRLSASDRAA